ncbi:MAG: cell division protein FtsQ/DivIB, partial [Bacilli bacterium]|nr:cell division protein FtsQ/DivIB [Bacilli bacterium]
YKELIAAMNDIDSDILKRISEIEYDPNSVDSDRFLLYMNDGNYVYLTLDKFDSINSYLDIIKNVEGKKGILYLDYGNNFTVIEE